MRITDVRAVLLSQVTDPSDPMVWVGGRIDSWDAALVEITTEDGTTGLGEVAQGIMAAIAVPGIVEALKTYLVGLDIDDPATIGHRLRAKTYFWARGGISSGVIGALEVAAWDAAGKIAGKPAYELMGGTAKTDIEAYASGGLGTTFEQVAAWVDDMQDRGFNTVKFRAMDNPDRTIDLVDHLLARLRPGCEGILDAVQGCAGTPWPLEDAIRVGRHLDGKPIRWYEEPRRVDDLDGYVALRNAVQVPVSGAESLALADEMIRLVEAGGVDVAQPDACMIGGPSEFRRVARAAAAAGTSVVPHVWGSAVTLMANLHVAFACAEVNLFEWCTLTNSLREELMLEPLVMTGSRIQPPTAPGLGVVLTPELEKKFPFTPGGGHVIR
jgi:L-alanine-DL-glutamate epimerase-like enolase superfamily enzyme